MRAILLVSHGSRSAKTKEEIESLIKVLKVRSNIEIFEFAFMEIEKPSIPEGLDVCVAQGATEIIVLLNFLNAGRHVNDDIPAIVQQARNQHRNVNFKISAPVGQHPRIAELFLDLIDHA